MNPTEYVIHDDNAQLSTLSSKPINTKTKLVRFLELGKYIVFWLCILLFPSALTDIAWIAPNEDLVLRCLLIFWFYIFIAFLTIIVHELLHALACVIVKVKIRGFGILSDGFGACVWWDGRTPVAKWKRFLQYTLPFWGITVPAIIYMLTAQYFSLIVAIVIVSNISVTDYMRAIAVLRAPKGSMIIHFAYITPIDKQKPIHLRTLTIHEDYAEVMEYIINGKKSARIIPDQTNEELEKYTQKMAQEHNITDIRYR